MKSFQTKRSGASTCHLYGKSSNSGENSNGTVHPGGMISEKGNTFQGITLVFPTITETTIEFQKLSLSKGGQVQNLCGSFSLFALK